MRTGIQELGNPFTMTEMLSLAQAGDSWANYNVYNSYGGRGLTSGTLSQQEAVDWFVRSGVPDAKAREVVTWAVDQPAAVRAQRDLVNGNEARLATRDAMTVTNQNLVAAGQTPISAERVEQIVNNTNVGLGPPTAEQQASTDQTLARANLTSSAAGVLNASYQGEQVSAIVARELASGKSPTEIVDRMVSEGRVSQDVAVRALELMGRPSGP